MARGRKVTTKETNGANLGFEEKLWLAADKLRGHMDASEYKHVVLGLIFLKYISDAFMEQHDFLARETCNPASDYFVDDEEQRADIVEDRDEYTARNVFWVPQEARWNKIQAKAKLPEIGKVIDDAMTLIEKENPSLRGVLSKDYARPTLDKQRLGGLVDLVGSISLGDYQSRSQDVLGRVYEYFIGKFASAEGKAGGEFYTPQSVVKLLVEMIEPYKGRIYDPCCGSGGMFVQSEKFVLAHGGRVDDLSIYGQESNPTTWRLCKMNLAIRGISGNIGSENADTFHRDLHKDLKADYILANPPFNMEDWGYSRLKDDARWAYGKPPIGGLRKRPDGSTIYVDGGNANYAWMQHFVHHLAPNGIAGFIMANGSMSSNQSGEGDIRKALIESDLVDCIVALPGQLFYTTQIPVCLWFLAKNKANYQLKDRSGQVLFIDARTMGVLIDRSHRELNDNDILQITQTYHCWQERATSSKYEDVPGFCKSVTIQDISDFGYTLSPGRYVGTEDNEFHTQEATPLVDLFCELRTLFDESRTLDDHIIKGLEQIIYE